MRPGEVVQMRKDLIDTRGSVWVYRPREHKGKWRNKERLIPLSSECQRIIAPFLDRPDDAYLFSPAEASEWWKRQRAAQAGAKRKTKVFPSELRARARKKRHAARRQKRKEPLDHYTQHSYRQALEYAQQKARAAGHEVPAWKPYALRHTRITEVQSQMGWDEAQAVAGHESPSTTARYSHERYQRALRIAAGTQPVTLGTCSDATSKRQPYPGGETVSAGAGTAISPTGTGASRFGTGFVEPVGENGLGMRRRPAVGQHLFQLWIVRMQAKEKFAYVGPGFDAMAFCACQDGTQHCRPWARGFAAQEEPRDYS